MLKIYLLQPLKKTRYEEALLLIKKMLKSGMIAVILGHLV